MGANSKVCSKNRSSKDLASTEQRELFQMQLLGWSDRNALLAALAKPVIVSRQPAARTVSRPIDRLIPHHRGLEPLKEFKFYPYVDPGAYIIQYRRDCSSVSTPDGRQGPLEMFALIGACAQDRQTVDVVDSENGPTETTVQLPSVSKGDENINGSSVSCATHFESLDTVSDPPLQNEPPLASCGMETAQADTIAEIHSPTVLSAPRSCGHTRAVRPTIRDNQFAESQLAHQKKPYGGLRYGASVAPAIVTKYTSNQKEVGKYLFLTGTNVAVRQNALRHDALMSLVLSTTASTSRTAEESCRKTRSSGLNKGLTATYLQPLVSRSHVAQPKLRRNGPGPKIKGGKVKDLTAPKQTNMSNSSLPLKVRDAADPNFAEVLFVKLLQVEQCQRRQNSLGALDIPKSEAASPLEQFERVHSSAIPADTMDTYQLGLRKSAERDSFNATVIKTSRNASTAPSNKGIASETHEKQGILQLSSLPSLTGTATTMECTSTTKSKRDKPRLASTSVLHVHANHLRKKSSSATLSVMYKTYVDKTRDLIHPLRPKSCFSDSIFRKQITIPWRLKQKDDKMPAVFERSTRSFESQMNFP